MRIVVIGGRGFLGAPAVRTLRIDTRGFVIAGAR